MRTICVLAAALLAALALAACGGSDEPPVAATPPPAATTTEPPTEPTPPAETDTEPAETDPPATTEERFDVDVYVMVEDGERVGGEGRVGAKKGDRVRIEIAVDAPQEFHLHGYELSKNATPDKPAVFQFQAKLEGVFELESHLSEAVIVNVVVEP
jgi:hypothetical protein